MAPPSRNTKTSIQATEPALDEDSPDELDIVPTGHNRFLFSTRPRATVPAPLKGAVITKTKTPTSRSPTKNRIDDTGEAALSAGKETPGDRKDAKRLARWKKTSCNLDKWKVKAKSIQNEVVEKQKEAAKAQAKCDKLAALLAKQDELDQQMSEESD